MGSQQSIQNCNFEDIQNIISDNNGNNILINTLSVNDQECLIKNTIKPDIEINVINRLISNKTRHNIFIYGKNCNDDKVFQKYKQLKELGVDSVYIYKGGLFEWLCLQDIYGDDEFPTTKKELDILKFKPISNYNKLLLTDID